MNPKGQHWFEIYTTLSYVRVASYTSHTLPCLNPKPVAVKVISKVQQPLALLTDITITIENIFIWSPHKLKIRSQIVNTKY